MARTREEDGNESNGDKSNRTRHEMMIEEKRLIVKARNKEA